MTVDLFINKKKKKKKLGKFQNAKAFIYLDLIDGVQKSEKLWTNESKQTWSIGGDKRRDDIIVDPDDPYNLASITFEEGIGWYI